MPRRRPLSRCWLPWASKHTAAKLGQCSETWSSHARDGIGGLRKVGLGISTTPYLIPRIAKTELQSPCWVSILCGLRTIHPKHEVTPAALASHSLAQCSGGALPRSRGPSYAPFEASQCQIQFAPDSARIFCTAITETETETEGQE